MSIIQPTKVGVQGERDELEWEAEQSLTGAGNGSAIIFPRGINGASVTVKTDGAQVSVESTTNSLKDVEQEKASVTWITWAKGVIVANDQDYVKPVTAIRLVQGNAGATGIFCLLQ